LSASSISSIPRKKQTSSPPGCFNSIPSTRTRKPDRVRKEAASIPCKTAPWPRLRYPQGEALVDLYERLNTAKQHFAEVSTTYGANHSEYRKAANALAEVERELEDTRRNVGQRVETDYRQASNREQMLQKSVRETKAEYDQLNARSFEYQQLKREAEADRGLYGDLERRIKEAGINAGFQNNSIRIADLARPPYKPVFLKTGLKLLLAFVFLASSPSAPRFCGPAPALHT
jgi:polysaccharide biosynthesis transport protein